MKSSMLFRRSTLLVLAAGMFSGASAADYQWDANGANPGLGGTGTWNTTNAFWDDLSAGLNDGNDTTQAVTISAITIGGANAASFAVNSTLPINIAPGGSSTINSTFTPTAGPGAYTATRYESHPEEPQPRHHTGSLRLGGL